MTINLANVKEEAMGFMDKGKYIKPTKLLYKTLRSIQETEIPRFGDLLVELARKYPDLFIEKIYVTLQFQTRKNFPQNILFTLDKYIIENYCLLQGESIKDSFYGILIDKYYYIRGRIFLTNLRLIISGYAEPRSKSVASTGLISTLWKVRKEFIRTAIGRAIRKSLNTEIEDFELTPYALYYPIHNAYKIKKGKSAVSYKVDIEYERKGKSKVETLNVNVSPDKSLKKDPARKEEILSNIETLLIQNQ